MGGYGTVGSQFFLMTINIGTYYLDIYIYDKQQI